MPNKQHQVGLNATEKRMLEVVAAELDRVRTDGRVTSHPVALRTCLYIASALIDLPEVEIHSILTRALAREYKTPSGVDVREVIN